MAKKFKSFETRDKPRKRGARQHKKNKINTKKDRKNRQDTKVKERVDIIPKYPILDI